MPAEHIKSPSYIHDRLYGKIEFTPDDLLLYQTREITRLRNISLSAQPPWVITAGNCDSRFEHSVGTAHLAKIVGEKKSFRE